MAFHSSELWKGVAAAAARASGWTCGKQLYWQHRPPLEGSGEWKCRQILSLWKISKDRRQWEAFLLPGPGSMCAICFLGLIQTFPSSLKALLSVCHRCYWPLSFSEEQSCAVGFVLPRWGLLARKTDVLLFKVIKKTKMRISIKKQHCNFFSPVSPCTFCLTERWTDDMLSCNTISPHNPPSVKHTWALKRSFSLCLLLL